jgi:hypothetical protein
MNGVALFIGAFVISIAVMSALVPEVSRNNFGFLGPVGLPGSTGPKGPRGKSLDSKGLQGPTGPVGIAGAQPFTIPIVGLQGPTGPQGVMGAEGPPGIDLYVDATQINGIAQGIWRHTATYIT